ncbi:MAG: MBL fold metallo-hydrolase [Lachnospiraceae bacterium]|nr:MBL fold metallo-hydrolase [Lachnospiraceae bacterium]
MKKYFLTILCLFWLIIFSFNPTRTLTASNKGVFEIDFLDIGQGDSILVNCDGHYMLIDGGSSKASNLIFTVLKNKGISYLDYIVATHADEDHVGGLAGALNYAKVGTAYCSVTEHNTKAFNSFKKYLTKQGKSISIPSAGDSFALGSAKVTVLAPVGVSKSDDNNNNSIVLRIIYGETSFLLTGDAEYEEERQIMDSCTNIKSTVLKVGHHGSKNSTSIKFLYKVSPEYAVISVSADNSYGHPANEVLTQLNRRNVQVYRTDLQGDIHLFSDGKTVTFSTEKKSGTSTNVSDVRSEAGTPRKMDYILNTNTKKFHFPECKSVENMKEKNKKAFHGSRDEVISLGYSPCGNCRP